jgi:hypothetical protein
MRAQRCLAALLVSILLASACIWHSPTSDRLPYPQPHSKKGLQVQMVEDAVELGIAHAAINVDLVGLFAADTATNSVEFAHGGRSFWFDGARLAHLDSQVKPLSDRGIVVSLILLDIRSGDETRDRAMLHPKRTATPPNGICAPNLIDEDGRARHAAAIAMLAQRYDPGSATSHGAAWNWIVGNEVNSHWWWFHMGRAGIDEVVDSYEQLVRLVHEQVVAVQPEARVFVSLEHHWNVRYAAGDEMQAFPARDFLKRFAARARDRGDFAWHVAFHPYPEDLFECRFWNDRTAPDRDDAERVTFRNLPVLTRFLAQPEMLHRGATRRVILSEQGFHRRDGVDGERDQAAAFAAAWMAVQREPFLDAFILHRHVDHAHEGGLQLGLWTRRAESVCDPDRATRMRDVFAACDGSGCDEALEFALDALGIATWDELPSRLGHQSRR